MKSLSGRRIVITGATGGIGSVLAHVFADLGAQVIGFDRNGADFSKIPTHETYAFDLTDSDALGDAIAKTCRNGTPAAIISNAGYTLAESLTDLTPKEFGNELNLNLTAAVELSLGFLPHMRECGGGNFVFISSVNALSHLGNPAYAVAKSGLLAWSRAIATEEGQNGIRSNTILPGSVQTPAWDQRLRQNPDIVQKVQSLYPLNRFVTPEEVAHTAAFLASDLSSGITGAAIPVDAGLSAGNLPFINEISQKQEI